MPRRLAATAAVALAAALLVPTGSSAAFADSSWQPYPEGDLSWPAGAYCDFAFSAHPVRQDVRYRTVETWPDGSPRIQEFAGLLVSQFTNDETGASVELNLSGTATVWLRADGSFERYETNGPVGLGFHAGDDVAQGYYRLLGHHVVEFGTDGSRSMIVDQGTEQDVCDLIG